MRLKCAGDWLKRVLAFRGNIRVLSLTSLLRGTSLIMLRVTLQPFILSLGASMLCLGFLKPWGVEAG